MRVRLKTIMAGPGGTAQPGQVIDVPDATAEALIAGRHAEAVGSPEPVRREIETAALIQPETGVAPKRARRR